MMNKEYCRYIHTYSELEGLADVGQSYELLENAGTAGMIPDFAGDNLDFCALCRF